MNSKYQGSEYSENGDGDEDFVESDNESNDRKVKNSLSYVSTI
jgi:hypothetical protein